MEQTSVDEALRLEQLRRLAAEARLAQIAGLLARTDKRWWEGDVGEALRIARGGESS